MQQLLNICHTYSIEHSLLYNGNKSFSMCFKPSTIKFTRPLFSFARMNIPIVTHCEYLGVMVSEHNSDNDLKRQMRKFYNIYLYFRTRIWYKLNIEMLNNNVVSIDFMSAEYIQL